MRARRGVRGKARGREYLSLGQAGEFFCLEALPSFSATATDRSYYVCPPTQTQVVCGPKFVVPTQLPWRNATSLLPRVETGKMGRAGDASAGNGKEGLLYSTLLYSIYYVPWLLSSLRRQ